jgi:hypothetical protein
MVLEKSFELNIRVKNMDITYRCIMPYLRNYGFFQKKIVASTWPKRTEWHFFQNNKTWHSIVGERRRSRGTTCNHHQPYYCCIISKMQGKSPPHQVSCLTVLIARKSCLYYILHYCRKNSSWHCVDRVFVPRRQPGRSSPRPFIKIGRWVCCNKLRARHVCVVPCIWFHFDSIYLTTETYKSKRQTIQ